MIRISVAQLEEFYSADSIQMLSNALLESRHLSHAEKTDLCNQLACHARIIGDGDIAMSIRLSPDWTRKYEVLAYALLLWVGYVAFWE